jgi:FdhE protein
MSGADSYDARQARALRLADAYDAVAAPLRFAAGLFRIQDRIARAFADAGNEPLTGQLDRDGARLLGLAEELFAFAETEGPPELAEIARARRADEPETARSRLLLYWAGERETADDFLSRALLRPYVETLAGAGIAPDRPRQEGHCPNCGGRPIVAVREGDPASPGVCRGLVCALCGGSWRFSRTHCPSCLEEEPAKLPRFQAELFPAVRLDACESCRLYVKSIDLDLERSAIPEVDDLASLPMDLWAIREGYRRIEPGWSGSG